MGVFRQVLINITQVVAGIMVIVGLSVVWSEGPDVLISMLKAKNYQIKDGTRLSYNTKDIENNNSIKSNYIVRLHTTDNRFFCTGFVISNNYLITAAHCLVNVVGKMRQENLYVVSSDHMNIQIGTAIGVEGVSDLALVQGDFSSFNKVKVMTNANDLFSDSKNYKACGYPMGVDEITCYKIHMKGNKYFQLHADGLLIRGQSGGPVIDEDKNMVIALNTAVDENGILLSPLVGIFSMFGVTIQ